MQVLSSQPRGLHNFIAEIRDCKSKDEERMRVDKELGNMRQKFSTSSALTSYQKKKYVWKMCYIFMLGYDVDFGHVEFISLLSSSKFQEKSVGYMAVALFLKPGDELMTLVVNSIRNDIVGGLNFGKTLALAAVSNIGGNDLAEALSQDVQRLIVSPLESGPAYNFGPGGEMEIANRANVCKKASLCLLRLYRTNPECLEASEWVTRLAKLLEDRDLGVITSAMSLLLGLAASNTEVMQPLVPYVISILTRLVINRTCSPDYMYYRTPSPWLQVKCLRFLQLYDCPEHQQKVLLSEALGQILTSVDAVESVNKSNADHSILVEACGLVLSYGVEAGTSLRLTALTLLGKFIGVREANIRYLGLDMMNNLVKREGPDAIKSHKDTVIDALKDTDVSVRKRSLDLLFSLTDVENSHEIVGELLLNLSSAESVVKSDMVVKIAILAEKFSNGDFRWYLDTMIRVILMAGDFVAEAVWHRVVVIVTNHVDIHEYAAERLLECVQSKWAHDIAIALAAYLLGEIGVNICDKPGMTGFDQFTALHQHFLLSSTKTQAILLTSYVKLFNLYPDTRDQITQVFTKYSTSSQLELQQRSCEYLKIPTVGQEIMEQVLNTMPVYSAEKENVLLTLNEGTDKDKVAGAEGRAAWASSGTKPAARVRSDSDGGGGGGAPVSASSASDPALASFNSPTGPGKVVDLLSLDDDVSTTSGSSSSGAVGVTPEEEHAVQTWLNAAILAPTGQKSTLYQHATMTVSSLCDFRAHQGRLQLLFYNKSSYDFTSFEVKVPGVEELVFRQQGPAVRITAGDEGKVLLAVECLRPFLESPRFEVSFVIGTTAYRFDLRLPIAISSFFEPVPTDKTVYMTRWKGTENEVQEVFTTTRTLDSSMFAHMRNSLSAGLRVGVAAELDTSERTLTGSMSFRTGTPAPGGPEGALVTVGVLFRLEADVAQSRFRITVRSKHPKVSQALVAIFKAQLS